MFITSRKINRAIDVVAQQVIKFEPDGVIMILEAARPFAEALVKRIRPTPERGNKPWLGSIKCSRVKVPVTEETPAGFYINITNLDVPEELDGRKIVLVDCICDTGSTFVACTDYLTRSYIMPHLVTASLLWRNPQNNVFRYRPDFYGIDLYGAPDFLYGFGLDLAGRFRDLDFINSGN